MTGNPSQIPASQDESPNAGTTIGLLRVAKVVVVFVYVFVLIDLVMLALGFFLRLFGASTDADFTRWVYRSVDRIMEPFRGMFPSHVVSDRSVIDTSLLFAMIVYTMVGIALHALVTWLTNNITTLRRRKSADRRPAMPSNPGTIPPPGPAR